MIKVVGAFALLFSSVAFAQQVGPPAPKKAVPLAGPMHVDEWASLGTYSELPAGSRVDLKVPHEGEEDIIVYGESHKKERAWRDDLRGSDAGYEAASSDAAQRLYAKGPEWASPDQERAVSDAKDVAGLCGGLFGLITCPGK